MADVRVSVLLPTHNRADVLPFAIQSILYQTFGDFEVLVAGDGCTDDTERVVLSFPDPRIRWFNLPKAPGLGYANRNVALRQARGDLVAYLEHDDIWMPDHLARMVAAFSDPAIEFVYSRGLAVGLDGVAMPYWFNLESRDHFDLLRRWQMMIAMSSVVHRRSSLIRAGYWDESLTSAGDMALWRTLTQSGDNFVFLREPTTLRCVADWRRAGERTRNRIFRWIDRATRPPAPFIPSALRFDLAGAASEQAAIWRRLRAAPQRECDAVRRAVLQLQDSLLWVQRGPSLRRGVSLLLGRLADPMVRPTRRQTSRSHPREMPGRDLPER